MGVNWLIVGWGFLLIGILLLLLGIIVISVMYSSGIYELVWLIGKCYVMIFMVLICVILGFLFVMLWIVIMLF